MGVARRFRVLAAALALALLPTLGGIAPSNAANLADYPSWEEVVAAQRNEAQAKALRASLEGQLAGLQAEAQRTQDEADAKGKVYAEAQQAYDEQKIETDSLVEQTAAAQAEADEAYAVAAQVIAEMSKSGGSGDISPRLFTTPGSPDALLDRLELSRVIGDRYADLYAKAIELRNRADALAAQAEVAQGILEELRIAAEKAFEEAQAAAIAAAEKLAQTERDIFEVRKRIEYGRRLHLEPVRLAHQPGHPQPPVPHRGRPRGHGLRSDDLRRPLGRGDLRGVVRLVGLLRRGQPRRRHRHRLRAHPGRPDRRAHRPAGLTRAADRPRRLDGAIHRVPPALHRAGQRQPRHHEPGAVHEEPGHHARLGHRRWQTVSADDGR
jgi:hypothetical protein